MRKREPRSATTPLRLIVEPERLRTDGATGETLRTLPRDCVVSYPAIDAGYKTLQSIDEDGNRYEEMRTPLDRVLDATECLLARLRARPRAPLSLLH